MLTKINDLESRQCSERPDARIFVALTSSRSWPNSRRSFSRRQSACNRFSCFSLVPSDCCETVLVRSRVFRLSSLHIARIYSLRHRLLLIVNRRLHTSTPPYRRCWCIYKGPVRGVIQVPRLNFKLGLSLFRKVPVSLSEFQHDVTTSMLTELGRKLYQASILYVRDCGARSWVRGLEPTGFEHS